MQSAAARLEDESTLDAYNIFPPARSRAATAN